MSILLVCRKSNNFIKLGSIYNNVSNIYILYKYFNLFPYMPI